MKSAACLFILLVPLFVYGISAAVLQSPETNDQLAVQPAKLGSTAEPQLKTVFLMHRHGNRNPCWVSASNPLADPKHWPEGWVQLTRDGKKRMLALGRYLRRRYDGFITGNAKEVYARASAIHRTTMSAMLVLAGAFPPDAASSFDAELAWQPIPVMHDHTMLGGAPHQNCPATGREAAIIENTTEVQSFKRKKENLLKTVSSLTGEDVKDLGLASLVQDLLKVAGEQGHELPSWATPQMRRELDEVLEHLFVRIGLTVKNLRLYTGLFFNDVKQKLVQRSEYHPHEDEPAGRVGVPPSAEDGSPNKLFLYATSDNTIAPVLEVLNAYDGKIVPYGASVILEHLQNNTVNWIRAFYLRETETEKPIPLKIRGCERFTDLCPLHYFLAAIEPYVVKDMEAECRLT